MSEETAFNEIMLATIDNSHENDIDIANIIIEKSGFVEDYFSYEDILKEIRRQKKRLKHFNKWGNRELFQTLAPLLSQVESRVKAWATTWLFLIYEL